eukprot:9502768-Pyramimonas_sp.AAC.1
MSRACVVFAAPSRIYRAKAMRKICQKVGMLMANARQRHLSHYAERERLHTTAIAGSQWVTGAIAGSQWATGAIAGSQGCALLACAPQIAYRSSACNTFRCCLLSRDRAAARGCSHCTGSMPAPSKLRVQTLDQVVLLFAEDVPCANLLHKFEAAPQHTLYFHTSCTLWLCRYPLRTYP